MSKPRFCRRGRLGEDTQDSGEITPATCAAVYHSVSHQSSWFYLLCSCVTLLRHPLLDASSLADALA